MSNTKDIYKLYKIRLSLNIGTIWLEIFNLDAFNNSPISGSL